MGDVFVHYNSPDEYVNAFQQKMMPARNGVSKFVNNRLLFVTSYEVKIDECTIKNMK